MLDKETTDLMDLRMKEPPPPYLLTVESAHPWFSFSNLKCLFHPFTPLPKVPKVPKLLKIIIDPPTAIPSPPHNPKITAIPPEGTTWILVFLDLCPSVKSVVQLWKTEEENHR